MNIPSKDEIIPYRDSKLTRILQNSLSGKSCVSVLCTLSPSSRNLEESISTLKFASRAKHVRNHAEVNIVQDESSLIKQYREEIDRLKRELEAYKVQMSQVSRAPTQTPIDESEITSPRTDKLEEIEMEQQAINAQIDHLSGLILSTKLNNEPGHKRSRSQLPQENTFLDFSSKLNAEKKSKTAVTSREISQTHSRRASFTLQINTNQNYHQMTNEQLIGRIRDLENINNELNLSLKDAQIQLDSWQSYYTQMNNKHIAMEAKFKQLLQEIERQKQSTGRMQSQPSTPQQPALPSKPLVMMSSPPQDEANPPPVPQFNLTNITSNSSNVSPRSHHLNSSIISARSQLLNSSNISPRSQQQLQQQNATIINSLSQSDNQFQTELVDEISEMFAKYAQDNNSEGLI